MRILLLVLAGIAGLHAATVPVPRPEAPVANEDLPEWLLHPNLRESRIPAGFSNCTSSLRPGADLTFHPDTICFERPTGHDQYGNPGPRASGLPELIRQEYRRVHFSRLSVCGGAEGDVSGLRVGLFDETGAPFAGEMTLCGPTGPQGFALCPNTAKVVCGE